jgi:hypothetical protein
MGKRPTVESLILLSTVQGLSLDELDYEQAEKAKKEGVGQAKPLGHAQRAEGTSRNGGPGWGAGH